MCEHVCVCVCVCSHVTDLEFVVLLLQCLHRVRDLRHGIHPLIGLLDQRLHLPPGLQPIGGVLQHVVKLRRPIRELGLGVLPVGLKTLDYNEETKPLSG